MRFFLITFTVIPTCRLIPSHHGIPHIHLSRHFKIKNRTKVIVPVGKEDSLYVLNIFRYANGILHDSTCVLRISVVRVLLGGNQSATILYLRVLYTLLSTYSRKPLQYQSSSVITEYFGMKRLKKQSVRSRKSTRSFQLFVQN